MKKISAIFLVLMLVLSMPLTCFAAELGSSTNSKSDNAVISANVPDSHIITVKTDGNGTVNFNGKTVTKFSVKRLSQPSVLIMGNSGYTIDTVKVDGTDVTAKVYGGGYTFDKVYKDETLDVTFKKASNGDYDYTLKGTVTRGGKVVSGLDLQLRSDVRTTVTDKNGKYLFTKVKDGHHTITAVENGKVVGFVELNIVRSDTTKSIKISRNANGTYTVLVSKDITIIELDFSIKDNGQMVVNGGKVSKNPTVIKKNPTSPDTGFKRNVMIGFAVTLSVAAVLALFLIVGKRNKEKQA